MRLRTTVVTAAAALMLLAGCTAPTPTPTGVASPSTASATPELDRAALESICHDIDGRLVDALGLSKNPKGADYFKDISDDPRWDGYTEAFDCVRYYRDTDAAGNEPMDVSIKLASFDPARPPAGLEPTALSPQWCAAREGGPLRDVDGLAMCPWSTDGLGGTVLIGGMFLLRSSLVEVTASGPKSAAGRVSTLLDTAIAETIAALQAAR